MVMLASSLVLDVHHVVLVDVDARLHLVHVRHAHDLGARELPGGHDAFAEFHTEQADDAVDGRVRWTFCRAASRDWLSRLSA